MVIKKILVILRLKKHLMALYKVRKNAINIFLIILILLFLFIFYLNMNKVSFKHNVTYNKTNKEQIEKIKIKVPEIIGKKFSDVLNLNKNYKIIKLCEEFNDQILEGYIISQNPYPGDYMHPNSIISVKVSKGSKDKILPEIFGMTLSQVSKILTELKLIPIEKKVPCSSFDSGSVIGYDAYNPGDKVEYGDRIVIIIGY